MKALRWIGFIIGSPLVLMGGVSFLLAESGRWTYLGFALVGLVLCGPMLADLKKYGPPGRY